MKIDYLIKDVLSEEVSNINVIEGIFNVNRKPMNVPINPKSKMITEN